MTRVLFSVEAVRRALAEPAVASVQVIETFPASAAEVARLAVRFSDNRPPAVVVGKHATGDGVAAVRRELRFYEQVAPRWAHPAPRLLGASGAEDHLLLLTEDLAAVGYALSPEGLSPAQLDAVTDTLVALHARFWQDVQPALFATATTSVTRATQAWPVDVIAVNARAIHDAAARFPSSGALAPTERALLDDALAHWEARFVARAGGGHALTLIHGDFHLLGNIFFAPHAPAPRVIDWSELKPGLGPNDLAYALLSAPAVDRPARDLALLRRYHDGLAAAGVTDYGFALCQWDYRFSLVTNLFQAVFQDSAHWFRKTAAVVDELDGRAALRDAPPGL
jgi:aminoglycoside phosphotransferase (APT) family kinase protein